MSATHCSRCGVKKTKKNCRIRKSTGNYNNTCKKCDTELAKIYYKKIKDDPSFKKRNCERVKKYRILNPQKVKEAAKKKRDNPINKERRKLYDKKNKKRIALLGVLRNQRYLKKQVDLITDKYVIFQLRTEHYRKTGICKGLIFSAKEIREKKLSIATNRIKKAIKMIDDELAILQPESKQI